MSRKGLFPCTSHNRYAPPCWIRFLLRFGLKIGIDFAQLVWNRVRFLVGTTGVYTDSKWNLRNLLCCFSSLSRDQVNLRSGDFFFFFGGEKKNSRLRPGLKTGLDLRGQV